MKKVGKVLLIIALILVLLLALAYGALQGLLGHGPFRFLNTIYLKGLPGNAEIYRPENVAPVENSPLSGMNLCFLGSSVTEGLPRWKPPLRSTLPFATTAPMSKRLSAAPHWPTTTRPPTSSGCCTISTPTHSLMRSSASFPPTMQATRSRWGNQQFPQFGGL